ncbi:helix-turn-helix domain-containing protein [Saccharolobus caldissimus]|uniref:Bacterio-opsin activator n=1 Tax=Saccharolobus caldissimus TaxID=1702097 RepID=A0AAQ4CUF4_9CREN|nr:helix-turn-helix domain-containing protein [Saccharolobus caldissimus]BDB99435.1 bacterio-opsin activator [Saccharolobus caldissimus]
MDKVRNSPYLKVKIIGTHDNCWSNKLDFNIKLINFQVIGGYVRSTLLVPRFKRRKTLKLLKDYYRIFIINNYQDFSSKSLITITKDLRDFSILNTLYKYPTIFLNNQYLNDGKEVWEFVTFSSVYNEIINELKGQLTIKKIEVSNYIPLLKPNLNSKEIQILYMAFKKGFFDFPRKTSIRALSKLLNIDEATLTYYLRAAERKLIQNVIDGDINDNKNDLV